MEIVWRVVCAVRVGVYQVYWTAPCSVLLCILDVY